MNRAFFATFAKEAKVPAPDWIWFVFIFAFGCCIGSFLNVVIYRLPRDKSLVTPPSACPSCGKHIRFYDNVPLVSWLVLGRKCRYCKAPISPRYFAVELLTGLVFLGLFIMYFRTDLRPAVGTFRSGGWLVYLLHIIMLGAFIAASGIDMEHWVIPLSICWFVTGAGLVASAAGAFVIDPRLIRTGDLLPGASAATGAMAAGAGVGLAVSLILTATGLLKRSYESDDYEGSGAIPQEKDTPKHLAEDDRQDQEPQFNHRLEAMREILFLLPIIACSLAALWIARAFVPANLWLDLPAKHPAVMGVLGSLWGYFIGCGTVWAVRIFGTLGFGKEAMGLGDVHLMGAAGAVLGPVPVVVAFMIAPFFGLAWVCIQMFFKKIRQIPYGPFLSIGVFAVMILHDRISGYIGFIFYR